MKPEIKELWCNALISGEYKQAEGYLRTPEGHCCLGVLTDLYIKETGKGSWKPVNSELDKEDLGYFQFVKTTTSDNNPTEASILPSEVKEWAGLLSCDPYVSEDDYTRSLSELNDKGASFTDIADAIRSQL